MCRCRHEIASAEAREAAPPLSPQQLDVIDRKSLRPLSDRARVVAQVGRGKRESGCPAYASHRDREVPERVLAENRGPLPGLTIEAIHRDSMSGGVAPELPLRAGFLDGPTNGQHTFFIEGEARRDDPAMRAVLESARGHCTSMKILGSHRCPARIL